MSQFKLAMAMNVGDMFNGLKRKWLEERGWRVGDIGEFLNLPPEVVKEIDNRMKKVYDSPNAIKNPYAKKFREARRIQNLNSIPPKREKMVRVSLKLTDAVIQLMRKHALDCKVSVSCISRVALLHVVLKADPEYWLFVDASSRNEYLKVNQVHPFVSKEQLMEWGIIVMEEK